MSFKEFLDHYSTKNYFGDSYFQYKERFVQILEENGLAPDAEITSARLSTIRSAARLFTSFGRQPYFSIKCFFLNFYWAGYHNIGFWLPIVFIYALFIILQYSVFGPPDTLPVATYLLWFLYSTQGQVWLFSSKVKEFVDTGTLRNPSWLRVGCVFMLHSLLVLPLLFNQYGLLNIGESIKNVVSATQAGSWEAIATSNNTKKILTCQFEELTSAKNKAPSSFIRVPGNPAASYQTGAPYVRMTRTFVFDIDDFGKANPEHRTTLASYSIDRSEIMVPPGTFGARSALTYHDATDVGGTHTNSFKVTPTKIIFQYNWSPRCKTLLPEMDCEKLSGQFIELNRKTLSSESEYSSWKCEVDDYDGSGDLVDFDNL